MIHYLESSKGIGPEQLRGFFSEWREPLTPETHLAILQGSDYFVLAQDEQNGRVVGFITVLTDGVQAAFIPLLEVVPDYRGRGVGSELVRRVLKKFAALPAIDLMCDPKVQPFYARLGMKPSAGMIVRAHRP